MEYVQDPFHYVAQPPPEQVFYRRAPYAGFPMHQPSPQQLEELYHRYPHQPHQDYSDFVLYQEEYDDPGEVSTRPRLTREQAEVLEAHFQANHKPNSMVKRQLAMQTKLTLPRVANWFQNRRAKAKQLKKQEEFESIQAQSQSATTDEGQEEPAEQRTPSDKVLSRPREAPESTSKEHFRSQDSQPSADQVSSQQASWASLQRALRQAEMAKIQQRGPHQSQVPDSIPQAEQLQPQSSQLPGTTPATQILGHVGSQWQARNPSSDTWTPKLQFQDIGFDFGFDQPSQAELAKDEHVHQVTASTFVTHHNDTACNAWQGCVANAQAMVANEIDTQYLGSPDLQLPQYSASRRGSAAESLTATFDTFALANDSPRNMSSSAIQMAEPVVTAPEAHLDIAARRNRPRPAALTSASLRSRSYGAATSMSPTFRTGAPLPPNALRHVKSQGHSLNARFTGIRKPHSAQRSPINVSTFSETETWDRLMAQRAAAVASSQMQSFHVDKVDNDTLLTAPCPTANSQQLPVDDSQQPLLNNKYEQAGRYPFTTGPHLAMSASSPPITPYATELAPSMQQLSVPPVSAPPQYASFPDYTPPYSAGPLTESSWSDAPLASPELNNMTAIAYMQPMQPTHKMESPRSHFQHFMLPSDAQSDRSYSISTPELKKTEFFIQEFPNQKEEHASIAQQLSRSRPKNYVFSNTAAGDYDHS